MATIEQRGYAQYRVKVRRRGVTRTKTFESLREAQNWARIEEGRISGEDFVDRQASKLTFLRVALDLYEKEGLSKDAKNKKSKLNYWRSSKFADWSLVAIQPIDLIEWRKAVLDEANAEDNEPTGPEAECSAQTVVHRLNTLSQVYKHWIMHRDRHVANPVMEGVRPSVGQGRDRRLEPGEEKRLLKAVERSSRPWLKPAVIISLETTMRQAELAGLAWQRVHLVGDSPHVYLPKTKNKRARTVPLSPAAVRAFRTLAPGGRPPKSGPVLPIESPRAIGHAWRDVVTEQNFPDLRWHDLRHEGISRLFERTDLRDHEIMAISGHLTPAMLERYTHLRAASLAKRLARG